ncbi:MAG: hypothetical protein ACD_5C00092G0002 [uncultured bacterium]|nr:MAG: hypothetical protein ACD_5C00092G0002 [uncultured bacterium]
MVHAAKDLSRRLKKIEREIEKTDNSLRISELNIEAMSLRRELGLPLDN